MPNSFTGDPSLNDDASSSSSSSTLPDQSSSHVSPIPSPLQEMLDEIRLKLNDLSYTSEEDELYQYDLSYISEEDELYQSLEELRDAANKGYSRWDAPEWLNFLSKLSMLMVEAIETDSYNKSILFVLIDLMEGNVPGVVGINQILVPIVSAAAKKGHIEILKRFKNAIMDESPEIVSTLACSREPLRQAILHGQVEATSYLMKHYPLSESIMIESIKELAKANEKLKTQKKQLQTEITLLETKNTALETENTEFRSRLTALETENTALCSRLLDESNQSLSRTVYSVFGATSSSTSSSSDDAQSRSSQKRATREDEADNPGIKVKVSRSMSS